MKSFRYLKLMLLLIAGFLSPFSYAHGHTFTPDEDASFLSLMGYVKSIISLMRSSGYNSTLVTEYAKNASVLLNS
jgi:hypothetical protein